MTSSLVDSNVIIDLLDPDSRFGVWSFRQLDSCSKDGTLVINQIVYAETAEFFADSAEFDRLMGGLIVVRDDLPWNAAGIAGFAHRNYRQSGGERDRVLPDFLIGAHAMTRGFRLLTRDPRRYRQHFPTLDIIAPDTHP
jgi:predicted nucleic acid-binding protein